MTEQQAPYGAMDEARLKEMEARIRTRPWDWEFVGHTQETLLSLCTALREAWRERDEAQAEAAALREAREALAAWQRAEALEVEIGQSWRTDRAYKDAKGLRDQALSGTAGSDLLERVQRLEAENQRLRRALETVICNDKTHYKNHEPRPYDGLRPREHVEGGAIWRTPREVAESVLASLKEDES